MRILFLADVPWTYLPQRHHQLVRRMPAHWRILFVQPLSPQRLQFVRPRRDANVTYAAVPIFMHFPSGSLQFLLRIRFARGVATLIVAVWLALLLGATRFRRPDVILVSNIYYARIIRLFLRGYPVVYDLNDHPTGFPNVPAWAGDYFRDLCHRADRIVCSAQALSELVAGPDRHKTTRIGNGVDMTEFHATESCAAKDPPRGEPPQDAAPRLLYLGVIFERFDFVLARQVALAFPHARLVLAGPAPIRVKAEMDALVAMPNVTHVRYVPPAERAALIASAHVCLIPFVKNEFTRCINPLKLYEYLAGGKPVVSIDFSPEVCALSEVIFLANDTESFIRQISAALVAGDGDAARRKQVATTHDWSIQAAAFAQVVEQAARCVEDSR